MIFALLYGLGLRVGEVSRLCRKDIDLDSQLLIIRQTKFEKDRLVPFGPKMARAIAGFLDREESRFGPIPPDCSAFSFDKRKRTPIGPNTISWTFHKLLPALQLTVPSGVRPPHTCIASVIRSPWARCCAGTGQVSTLCRVCSIFPRSWVTSALPRPLST
jgi:integrase